MEKLSWIVSSIRRELGIEPIVLKGYSIQRFFPAPYDRWMRDSDLMFRDAQSAFAVYEWLCDNGYEIDQYEIPWFKKYRDSLYGQIVIGKTYNNDYVRFDLHYGKYSVSYSGFLDDDLWINSESISMGDTLLKVLTPSRCLLLSFAHVLSQGCVSVKDINDIVSILLASDFDWLELTTIARHNRLEPVMYQTMKHLQNLYDYLPLQEKTTQMLRHLKPSRDAQSWHFYRRSWTRRAWVNSLYTYRFEHQHNKNNIVVSGRIAIECFLYYIRQLHLDIRTRKPWEAIVLLFLSKPSLLEGRINTKTCVRLAKLPYNHFSSLPPIIDLQCYVYCPGKLIYLEEQRVGVIISGRHIYIPTIDYILSPQQVEAGRNFVRQLYDIDESRTVN